MRRHRLRDDSGAVALMVALLSLVLFGSAAFVTDFGYAYFNQRSLQNGVDAAALAVGQKIASTASRTDTCDSLKSSWTGAPALAAASTIFKQNVPSANDPSPTASIDSSTVDCEIIPGSAVEQLVITVGAKQKSPTFFGKIFGVQSLTIGRQARVITSNALPYGLRPFAICSVDASVMATSVPLSDPPSYVPHTVVFPSPSDALKKANGGCGGATGNAGLLDLDGGGGGRGAHGACGDGVKDWISCGFNGTLPDPSNIDGQPGGFGGGDLSSYMATLAGQDIALPVFDTVSGSGANATYHVTGFVVVNVCGWDFQAKPGDIASGSTHQYGCYNAAEWTASAAKAQATWGNNNMAFVQLEYIKTITAGQIDGKCKLGDTSCSWGALVNTLAD